MPEWHCPACGEVMTEADNGMECPEHGHWTWAQLASLGPDADRPDYEPLFDRNFDGGV